MGVSVGVANFFWGQSINNDETNTFQLTFFSSMKIVGAAGLGGFWALEWAWQKGKLVIILKFKTIEHVCYFKTKKSRSGTFVLKCTVLYTYIYN